MVDFVFALLISYFFEFLDFLFTYINKGVERKRNRSPKRVLHNEQHDEPGMFEADFGIGTIRRGIVIPTGSFDFFRTVSPAYRR